MASLFKLEETASWIASWIEEEGSSVSAAGNSRRFTRTAKEQRSNYMSFIAANRVPPIEYEASIDLLEQAAKDATVRAEIEAEHYEIEVEKRKQAERQYLDQVRQRHSARNRLR